MATADLVVRIVGNADALTKGLGGAESRLGSFGTKMRTAGVALTAGLTVPIIAFAAKSAKAFRESQAAMGQTEAVIKSTGGAANLTAGDIDKLASRMQRLTAFEDDAVQQSSNLLLTFTNVRDEVGKGNQIFTQAQTAILDMATAMNKGVSEGADLSGATIQLGKALNDPIKGITALTRVGVTFTQQQKDQIKALVESGDTLGAQKIILGELAKEFGGSAKAYAEGAGKGAQAANRLAEAQERVGAAFDPIRTKGLETVAGLAEKAAEAFDKLSPGLQEAAGVGVLAASALGPVATILGQIAIIRLPGKLAAQLANVGTTASTAAGAAGVGRLATALTGLSAFAAAHPILIAVGFVGAVAAIEIVTRRFDELEKEAAAKPPIALKVTLDDTLFNEAHAGILGQVGSLSHQTATPAIDANADKFHAVAGEVSSRGNRLSGETFVPKASLDSTRFSTGMAGAQARGRNFSGDTFTARADVDTRSADSGLGGLLNRLRDFAGRTFTAFTRILPFGHEGGLVLHAGGLARFHAGGGLKADEVPAILQRGEFVMRKQAVDTIGVGTLARLNRLHDGGAVGSGARGGGTTNIYVTVQAGSVVAERDLVDKIQRGLIRTQGRNVTTGIR